MDVEKHGGNPHSEDKMYTVQTLLTLRNTLMDVEKHGENPHSSLLILRNSLMDVERHGGNPHSEDKTYTTNTTDPEEYPDGCRKAWGKSPLWRQDVHSTNITDPEEYFEEPHGPTDVERHVVHQVRLHRPWVQAEGRDSCKPTEETKSDQSTSQQREETNQITLVHIKSTEEETH